MNAVSVVAATHTQTRHSDPRNRDPSRVPWRQGGSPTPNVRYVSANIETASAADDTFVWHILSGPWIGEAGCVLPCPGNAAATRSLAIETATPAAHRGDLLLGVK